MWIPTRASRHRTPGTPRDQLELQRFVSGIDGVAFGIHASRGLVKEGSTSIAGADGRYFDGPLLLGVGAFDGAMDPLRLR